MSVMRRESYEGPFWFPFPPDDEDSRTTWSVDVVRAWSDLQGIYDREVLQHYREAVLDLLDTTTTDDFPSRALLLAPAIPGFMVEFAFATAQSGDWIVDQARLLDSLEEGAIRKESAVSDVLDVLSTISITVHREDCAAEVGDEEEVFGQLLIVARREQSSGVVDLVGRVVNDDVDLLDLCIPPLMAFLHGDDLLAAVQAD